MTTDAEALVRRAYHLAEGNVMHVQWFIDLFAADGVFNATGRRNFVLAGIATDVCAAPAAISAAAEGYNVKVVVDACGSRTKLADDAALGSLTAAGISLVSTGAMLTELVKDWTSRLAGRYRKCSRAASPS